VCLLSVCLWVCCHHHSLVMRRPLLFRGDRFTRWYGGELSVFENVPKRPVLFYTLQYLMICARCSSKTDFRWILSSDMARPSCRIDSVVVTWRGSAKTLMWHKLVGCISGLPGYFSVQTISQVPCSCVVLRQTSAPDHVDKLCQSRLHVDVSWVVDVSGSATVQCCRWNTQACSRRLGSGQ